MATKGPPAKRRRARTVFDDPEDVWGPPTKAERAALDRESARPYKASYEAGRKAGRAESKGKGGAKGKSRRRSVPGGRSARAAARQLQAPIRAQVTSGLRVVGLTLGVVALYLVLTNASAFAGALGGLGRAFEWLGAADRSVPYNRR